jgi:transcriptional antiterminator RfaH
MDKVWRAFYTKPRHEIKILNRIIESGLEGYCPLVKSKVKWSDRWKKVTKPAMPGYVFAKVSEEERVHLLNDESIFRTVMWNKKLVTISDEEIELMQLVLEDAEVVHVESLSEGDLVTVQRGTMSGHNGIVVQISNKTVRLKIDSFNCDMIVTVPLKRLEKVKKELSKTIKK